GQCPAYASAQTVDDTLTELIIPLHHEQRSTKNGAVHRNEWEEHTECCIEGDEILVEHHFENLHDSRDDADIGQQAQEAQVYVWQPCPRQSAFSQQSIEDKVIDRHSDGQNDRNCDTQTNSCLDFLGDGQEGTHTQKEGQGHVFDKDCLDEQTQILLEHQ